MTTNKNIVSNLKKYTLIKDININYKLILMMNYLENIQINKFKKTFGNIYQYLIDNINNIQVILLIFFQIR